MLLHLMLVSAMVVCALGAIRARQLLSSVIWLAGLSALVAILLYLIGAPEIAVIELSVGAGLVTVLFVFAIGIAGEITRDLASIVPRWLAWIMSGAAVLLLGWLILPFAQGVTDSPPAMHTTYSTTLWESRAIDMMVAILLVFTGVLGMLSLLEPTHVPERNSLAESPQPDKQTDFHEDDAQSEADTQPNRHRSREQMRMPEVHP